MSRKTYISILACLLSLLPILTHAQSLTKYEYWFDDNYSGRKSGNLSGTNKLVNTSIVTDGLDNGVHKFSFRAKQSDGYYSAVTSSLFLKRTAATSSQMEYWFDNNFDQRESISIGNTEEEQSFVLDLRDNAKFPMGFHKLNIRITLEGEGESTVYSSPVLKLSAGTATALEYWIDDDIAHSHTFEGHLASDGKDYFFVSDLDLGDVSPGYHRLYCRAVSNSKRTVSSVSMTPIMVKSMYNANGDVKMASFSFAVDDENPVTVHVTDSRDELKLNPYTIDMRDLDIGNHILKGQFWNSANESVSFEQNFKVNPIEIPNIQLVAEEKDGLVTLKFNSIPNDVKWGIVRIDANGAKAKIAGKNESNYPLTITTTDNPPKGEFTYMARCYYNDFNGGSPAINSNEVKVIVCHPQNNGYGKIIGDVRVGNEPLWGEKWKVTISDGDEVVELETDKNGLYYYDKIPVGKVLDITVQARDYKSETQTVTIKEGENIVHHQGIFDVEAVKSRYVHDLQFDSDVEFTPGQYMKFKVKNITRFSWHGKLRIVTARKEFVDNPPKNPFESNDAQLLAGSVAPFVVNDYYQYDYSDEIWLSPDDSTDPNKSTAEIVIKHHVPITTPPTGKDEFYYFFVESVAGDVTKLVAVNDAYNIEENPLVQLIDNGDYYSAEEDIEACVSIIMELCSTVKEFDGKLGDMSKCMDEMQEALGYTLDYYDLAEKIERNSAFSSLKNDVPAWKFYNILYHEDRRFLGMVNSVRDKIAEEVRKCKDILDYTKKVKKCIDAVKQYNQWKDMTDLERAGSIAEKILSLSEKSFPFAKILRMYLDVTEKTIDNIFNLAEKWNAVNDYSTFYHNYDNDWKFDIRVKKKGWITTSFDAEAVKEHILSAEIKCIAGSIECTATYTPEVVDGVVRLTRINKVDNNLNGEGPEVPIDDMWMTIRWSNGRVSYVPIRSNEGIKGNGVKHNKKHYTITFQSKIDEDEYMADIINLDD